MKGLRNILMLAALLMLLVAGPAWADDYVFMYTWDGSSFGTGTDYFLGNNTVNAQTSFVPNNSIYRGTSGGKFRNDAGYYIRYNNGLAFTNRQDRATNLTINNDNQVVYNNTYYLNHSGNNARFYLDNDPTYYTLANPVTTTSVNQLTDFTISGATTFSSLSSSLYSHTSTYYKNYTKYEFNSRTYYSTDPAAAASTSEPSLEVTSSSAYTWALDNGSGGNTLDNGHVRINSSTGEVEYYDSYNTITVITIKCTASYSGQTKAATFDVTFMPLTDPTGLSVTAAMTVYAGQTSTVSYTFDPSPCYENLIFSSNNTSVATVNASGVVTGESTGTATITVTAYKLDGTSNSDLTKTVTVTVKDKVATPVITFTPDPSDNTQATAEITCATPGTTIYYTLNGGAETAYSSAFPVNEYDVVNAYAVKTSNPGSLWDDSDPTTNTYVSCSTGAPTITYKQPGTTATVTITAEPGATIYYTTNGDDPTTGSASGSSPLTVGNVGNCTFKAIAKNGTCSPSAVVSTVILLSGVSGSVVTLNDLEDHTWTYYSAKPDNDYPDQLRSPDPRNVKITYRGGSVNNASAVAVSATESANEFVYYKTIEKKAWGIDEGRWLTGDYAYRIIPNPFQKRPRTNGTTGTAGFWGFNGWLVKSGGTYIGKTDNVSVLQADELVNFQNFSSTDINAIAAEIVLEAQWTSATVTTVNGDVSGNPNNAFTGGTYETNFIVVSGDNRTVNAMTRAATVMGCYPDGTGATGARLSTVTGSGNDLKIENINLGTGGNDFTANTGWLIVGRGCTGNVRRVIGNTGQIKIRIESGLYNFINPMSGGSANNANYGLIIFGNDYDRATNDGLTSNDQYADNSSHRKLRVINYVTFNGSGAAKASDTNRDEWMDITIKSGYYGYSADYSLYSTTAANNADGFGQGIGGNTDHAGTYTAPDINGTNRTYNNLNAGVNNTTYRWQRLMSFYCGRTRGGNYGGINRVLIEGGELNSINGGGYRNTGANFDVCYHFRMKGGWVKGAIYGTASSSRTNATTKQVITGGEINGWVAGACNGTDVDNDDGRNLGDTYIYLGGTAELRSHRKDGVYNNAWGLVGGVEGGNLFASGRGTPATTAQPDRNYCGSSYKTYAVVADQSQVEQGVYGGGYIGVAQNSHIYITGGTTGKVFGGASTPTSTNNTWMTQTTDIRQYGGTVKEGIYGGHFEGTGNAGKIHQTVNIAIDGGQVGVDADHTGKVHGGGYGAGTSVGGNVTVTLGKVGAADSATVFGNVYGGSALGSVNTNASNTTTVTMNKALINGNLFGGALGEGADVNGKITVTVNGGTVNGNVFGGGDAAAYSPNADYPVVNMTGGQVTNVFGGGMGNTAVVTGNPQVTLSGTAHVTGNVYGGGNAAEVTGNTNVKIQD